MLRDQQRKTNKVGSVWIDICTTYGMVSFMDWNVQKINL